MPDRLRLNQAVNLLTLPSKHSIDVDGRTQFVTELPLLEQLRQAVENSRAAATFASSSGNPLPLSADALDLLSRIYETVIFHWWRLPAAHRAGGGTLEQRLRAWAAASISDPDALNEAERTITGWVEEITGLFRPRRTREIIGHCPVCQATRTLVRDDEDGKVYRSALVLSYDEDGRIEGAECGDCGATWAAGIEVFTLARTVVGQ